MSENSETKTNKKKKVTSRYFDYSLLFVVIFMVGFGAIMIYSASSYAAQMDGLSSEYYFIRQLLYSGIGLVGMFITYKIDYRYWRKLAPVIFIGAILLIFMLIPFGSSANGATRWIRFAGIGVQPADLAKTAVIIMVSALVCGLGEKMKKFRYVLIVIGATAGFLSLLIYVISNNLSSALIVLGIAAVMTFIAYPGYKIYVFISSVAVAAFIGLYSWITSMTKSGNMPDSFRLERILVWTNPENYATGKGFQTVQALYAIGSGGLFGKGLGKSLQKLGYIPESQNDMIFSIICEELGLFGAACVIFVFGIMLWRIASISQNAPDLFGTMLAAGVFAHIAIQVVLNIAVVTNFIPNTGVSLPFISYGGTSSVVLLAEIGIVLNISSKIKQEK